MRKLSFKSFLRGASNDLLRCAILLLCALIVGSSSVWADVTPLNLPYNWTDVDGKSAYTENLGCTYNSLDTDYDSDPKLKFNATGSYLIIQVADAPEAISFNFKQNGTNAGTFKVQESTDGSNYTDATTVSWPGNTKTTLIEASLNESSRYIKLIYVTKGESTNVGIGSVAITKHIDTTPTIVALPSISRPASSGNGIINFYYYNFSEIHEDVQFYNEDGSSTATYDWIYAEINNDNDVSYTITENNSDSRKAYLKVWAYDDESNIVYSNLISITQSAASVDYAILPFSFDGGKADIDNKNGLSQSGLGFDYDSSPYLKFDGTGDYVILKINETPGVLTFDIKANSFFGTFQVLKSEDGIKYTALDTYTSLGAKQGKIYSLASTIRFIKWMYTDKNTGNVALGNIRVTKKEEKGTISACGWSTFSCTSPLDLSTISNGAAYYVSSASGSVVTLSPTTNTVPAGEGLMIKGAAGANFAINVAESGTAINDNLLKGQTAIRKIAASGIGIPAKYHYVFGYEDSSTFGFYNLTSATLIPVGKAYLETTSALTPAVGAPAIIRIIDEENNATSIERLDGKTDAIKFIENGQIYILREGVVSDALGRIVK